MTNKQKIANLEIAVIKAFDLIKELADIVQTLNEEVLKKLEQDDG